MYLFLRCTWHENFFFCGRPLILHSYSQILKWLVLHVSVLISALQFFKNYLLPLWCFCLPQLLETVHLWNEYFCTCPYFTVLYNLLTIYVKLLSYFLDYVFFLFLGLYIFLISFIIPYFLISSIKLFEFLVLCFFLISLIKVFSSHFLDYFFNYAVKIFWIMLFSNF